MRRFRERMKSCMAISGTLYQYLWFFMIYGFLGWVLEVVYQAVSQGLVVNRGFLNGPICPIYGVGMVGVLCLLGQYASGGAQENLPLLFLLGTLLATLVELAGGWALDRLFHTRWWDYSQKPFHFRGYICLEFSLIWGLAILVAADEIHPWVRDQIVARIPLLPGMILLGVVYAVFLTDLVLTVVMLTRMRRYLEELEEVQGRLRAVSDKLTEVIGGTTLKTARKVGEGQVQAALGRAELMESVNERYTAYRREMEQKRAELQQRADSIYERLLSRNVLSARRMLEAFPGLRSHDHTELMENLKQRWSALARRMGNDN